MRLRSAAIEAAIALLLIVPVLGPAPASANLLVNGNFEDGGGIDFGAEWYAVLAASSAELPGWVVTRDTIDYLSDARNPFGEDLCPDGDRCIDLDGTTGFGGIAQSFATTPGQSYALTFALSGNPTSSPPEPDVKLLRVLAAGTSADLSFDTAGHSGSNMGWIAQTWTFTAIDVATTLEFQSLDTAAAGYSGYFGPMIDDVAVNAIPEPSTGLLVMAGALIGCCSRRAKGPALSAGQRGLVVVVAEDRS